MMHSTHFGRFMVALAIAFVVGVVPASASAHQGGQPLLVVPVDHIVPGETFPVVAADLGPGSPVTIEITTADGVVLLGTATTGPDGHFQTTLVMPSTVTEGYLLISARAADGSEASTWVRIGTGGESAASLPVATGPDFWIDPSLLLLLGGVALALGVWFIRSRRGSSGPRPRG